VEPDSVVAVVDDITADLVEPIDEDVVHNVQDTMFSTPVCPHFFFLYLSFLNNRFLIYLLQKNEILIRLLLIFFVHARFISLIHKLKLIVLGLTPLRVKIGCILLILILLRLGVSTELLNKI
jgi:hypothetical protein